MSIKPSLVGIIGAGNVGAAIANALVLLSKSVTVVLFDRNLSKTEGQAWDINDAIPLLEEMDVIPSNRYEDLADSDIIIVTVSATQTSAQSRLDLLGANAAILRPIVRKLDRVAPDAIIILVSNPVDILTRIAIKTSTRSEHLIFGSGTVLDTARLQYQLGKRLNVDKNDVRVQVIGEHGDSEFPVWSNAAIGMIPLTEFPLPKGTSLEQIQIELANVTRDRGNAIMQRKGYTSYGIATSVAQLVDAIVRDEKRMFTVSVKAAPPYGVGNEVVLGLPSIIGKHGIESRLVLPRNAVEQHLLEVSAAKLNHAYKLLFEPQRREKTFNTQLIAS
ncbi:MAG: NAD(P)-binding domain-containing protein [Fischerella sp. CENA71]|nr:NAD(P)-binding domain-containing protein [Fischerella sp. CENA71]